MKRKRRDEEESRPTATPKAFRQFQSTSTSHAHHFTDDQLTHSPILLHLAGLPPLNVEEVRQWRSGLEVERREPSILQDPRVEGERGTPQNTSSSKHLTKSHAFNTKSLNLESNTGPGHKQNSAFSRSSTESGVPFVEVSHLQRWRRRVTKEQTTPTPSMPSFQREKDQKNKNSSWTKGTTRGGGGG